MITPEVRDPVIADLLKNPPNPSKSAKLPPPGTPYERKSIRVISSNVDLLDKLGILETRLGQLRADNESIKPGYSSVYIPMPPLPSRLPEPPPLVPYTPVDPKLLEPLPPPVYPEPIRVQPIDIEEAKPRSLSDILLKILCCIGLIALAFLAVIGITFLVL